MMSFSRHFLWEDFYNKIAASLLVPDITQKFISFESSLYPKPAGKLKIKLWLRYTRKEGRKDNSWVFLSQHFVDGISIISLDR